LSNWSAVAGQIPNTNQEQTMRDELIRRVQQTGYEPPAIEREIDAESMERERHYAGDSLASGPV